MWLHGQKISCSARWKGVGNIIRPTLIDAGNLPREADMHSSRQVPDGCHSPWRVLRFGGLHLERGAEAPLPFGSSLATLRVPRRCPLSAQPIPSNVLHISSLRDSSQEGGGDPTVGAHGCPALWGTGVWEDSADLLGRLWRRFLVLVTAQPIQGQGHDALDETNSVRYYRK
jgi:hypothetical protein